MSASTRRHPTGVDGQTILLIVVLVSVVGSSWLAVTWGSKIDAVNPELTRDPFKLFFGLLSGDVTWPASRR